MKVPASQQEGMLQYTIVLKKDLGKKQVQLHILQSKCSKFKWDGETNLSNQFSNSSKILSGAADLDCTPQKSVQVRICMSIEEVFSSTGSMLVLMIDLQYAA